MIRFVVPTVPIAQPRPRAVVRGHKPAMVEAFADHPVHAFKQRVRWAARAAWPGEPLATACSVRLMFVMARPQSMRWRTKPMPRVLCDTTPDLDNLAKSVLDACTGICWVDDRLIAMLETQKWVAAGNEMPRVFVEVSDISAWNGRRNHDR